MQRHVMGDSRPAEERRGCKRLSGIQGGHLSDVYPNGPRHAIDQNKPIHSFLHFIQAKISIKKKKKKILAPFIQYLQSKY